MLEFGSGRRLLLQWKSENISMEILCFTSKSVFSLEIHYGYVLNILYIVGTTFYDKSKIVAL